MIAAADLRRHDVVTLARGGRLVEVRLVADARSADADGRTVRLDTVVAGAYRRYYVASSTIVQVAR